MSGAEGPDPGVERVVVLHVGLVSEWVGAVQLLQQDHRAVVVFPAMKADPDGVIHHEDTGIATVDFERCHMTCFGGPNDEGRPEHPLATKGLSEAGYNFCEVLNSTWAAENSRMRRASAKRIWSFRGDRSYRDRPWTTRHFIITFQDCTFECLADDFRATLHREPFRQVLETVAASLFD